MLHSLTGVSSREQIYNTFVRIHFNLHGTVRGLFSVPRMFDYKDFPVCSRLETALKKFDLFRCSRAEVTFRLIATAELNEYVVADTYALGRDHVGRIILASRFRKWGQQKEINVRAAVKFKWLNVGERHTTYTFVSVVYTVSIGLGAFLSAFEWKFWAAFGLSGVGMAALISYLINSSGKSEQDQVTPAAPNAVGLVLGLLVEQYCSPGGKQGLMLVLAIFCWPQLSLLAGVSYKGYLFSSRTALPSPPDVPQDLKDLSETRLFLVTNEPLTGARAGLFHYEMEQILQLQKSIDNPMENVMLVGRLEGLRRKLLYTIYPTWLLASEAREGTSTWIDAFSSVNVSKLDIEMPPVHVYLASELNVMT